MSRFHVVVVPHTHWDREWYRSHEAFRYRLVRMLDGLLDLLEGDPTWRHFTLDGQAIVVDDYLEVRPEARDRIAKLVRGGRLCVGPWFVLPDEWLVSGEALIRNLRRGLARGDELGGAMRLGYVPDQFGHVGQLPQIFAGFGFPAAALWRGVGADVDRTLFHWEAPDGTRLLTAYLINGYGNAVHLPREPRVLARRIEEQVAVLAAHAPVPSLLFMNGSDHVAPEAGLPAALEAACALLEDVSVEIGTLPGYLERARREAPDELPSHRGELRSGLRAPLLPGCASTRMPQKRADFLNDRALTRYVEPLATWLEVLGGDPDPAVIDLAWRVLLENHPHDSICGCSIDAVHTQMDARFARVAEIASAHLARVTRELALRVAAPAGPGEPLVVWNPGPSGRGLVEGEVEVDAGVRAPALHLRDAAGRSIPVRAEVVEPGRVVAEYRMTAPGAAFALRGFPAEFGGLHACGVRLGRRGGGLDLQVLQAADPTAGFDFAAEVAGALGELEGAGEVPVRFRVRRLARLRVRFADSLPGCGLRAYRLVRGGGDPGADLEAELTPAGGAAIANAVWRLTVTRDGRVRCTHVPSGVSQDDVLRLANEGDRGDEYNFDPVSAGERVERPKRVRVGLFRHGGAEVGIEIDAHYRVPLALATDRRHRSRRRVRLRARTRLWLATGLDCVGVEIDVDNTARDQRLRAHVRAPFAASAFEVESAFEVAERAIAPAPESFGSARPAEFPIGATPQRSFATVTNGESALTVANRGCAEVEAVPEDDGSTSLALTVLRAVGWLSRDDLALRPGHAGPALETPGAQVPGRHRVEFAWRWHAAGDASRVAEAHRYAAPALAFRGGGAPLLKDGAPHAPLKDGARLLEIDDPAIVVTALEPRAGSDPLVRIWNASPQARRVGVTWRGGAARRLEGVDLAGRPDPSLDVAAGPGASARVGLRPWQIAGLRPRREANLPHSEDATRPGR